MATIIPQLIPIEINSEKRRQMVLTNIIKMLTERKLLLTEELDKNISDLLKNRNEDEIYTVKTKTEDITIILLLNQHITSITKQSVIGDYLYKNIQQHKIIVVGDINPRSRQLVQNKHNKIEIFLEKELMMNMVDCILVPKFEILTKEEADLLLEEYNVKKKQMPYILIDDPEARYYNMKVDQICRIKRPSEMTGNTNYYRLCISKSKIATTNK